MLHAYIRYMESYLKRIVPLIVLFLLTKPGNSQIDLQFGTKKIQVPGNEICSYTINRTSHLAKCYLDIKNEILLYTTVEFKDGTPVRIEILECPMGDLDKSSCSLGISDQKSTYTPGEIYIIYLYTIKDRVSISSTVYGAPDVPATVERSSVGRIHFRNQKVAEDVFENFFTEK